MCEKQKSPESPGQFYCYTTRTARYVSAVTVGIRQRLAAMLTVRLGSDFRSLCRCGSHQTPLLFADCTLTLSVNAFVFLHYFTLYICYSFLSSLFAFSAAKNSSYRAETADDLAADDVQKRV